MDFSDAMYLRVAERNLNFVLESQNADGSWYYSKDGDRGFIDHFHTCFVLKALAKIEAHYRESRMYSGYRAGGRLLHEICLMNKNYRCRSRAGLGLPCIVESYMTMLSVSISLCCCGGAFPIWTKLWQRVIKMNGWQKCDGSFRSRQLLLGWDNTPMHRWAQAQLFRSLCFLLLSKQKKKVPLNL